jgi:hypothetical protein
MRLEGRALLEMSDEETRDTENQTMEVMKTTFVTGRSKKGFVNGMNMNEQEVIGSDGLMSTKVVMDIVTDLVCPSTCSRCL